jgi:hypothetical protein
LFLRGLAAQVDEDPAVRKVRIEKALSVQKVTGCDAEGILQLGHDSGDGGGDAVSPVEGEPDPENHTYDEKVAQRNSLAGAPPLSSAAANQNNNNSTASCESSTCCICLEAYEVGDVVAWNRQRRCLHVFHRDCLAGWLAKHNDCPSCRLPILEKKKKKNSASQSSSTTSPSDVEAPAPAEAEHEMDDDEEANHSLAMSSSEDEEEEEEGDDGDAASVTSVSSSSGAVFAIVHGLIARVRIGLHPRTSTTAPQQQHMGSTSSSASSSSARPMSPMKTESSCNHITTSPAIFRRPFVNFAVMDHAPDHWTPVRGSSTSTSNETLDEECGVGGSGDLTAPLQRAVSVHSGTTSCGLLPCVPTFVEDRAGDEAMTLHIVQTTQPWMTETLLSDGDTTEEDDGDEGDGDEGDNGSAAKEEDGDEGDNGSATKEDDGNEGNGDEGDNGSATKDDDGDEGNDGSATQVDDGDEADADEGGNDVGDNDDATKDDDGDEADGDKGDTDDATQHEDGDEADGDEGDNEGDYGDASREDDIVSDDKSCRAIARE